MLRSQALAAGYREDEVDRLVRRRVWQRVRRGAYCERQLWNGADPAARHLLRVRAAALSLHRPAVASHVSAALALGLRVWGVPLDLVHMTRTDVHSPRVEGGVHHHAGSLADCVVEVDGLLVTSPARTALDIARLAGFERGVVTADSAIARPDCSLLQLRETATRMQDWPGARTAGRVASFADARSESVGESRTRVLFDAYGLPVLEPQVEILNRWGLVVARVDGLIFEADLAVEFDGRLKYGMHPDDTAAQASERLWREKRREDLIRRQGLTVERIVWADFEQPRQTAARLRAALRWRDAA